MHLQYPSLSPPPDLATSLSSIAADLQYLQQTTPSHPFPAMSDVYGDYPKDSSTSYLRMFGELDKEQRTARAKRQQKHYTAFLHNDGILERSDNSRPIGLVKKSSSTLRSLCSSHIPPSYITNSLQLVASLLAPSLRSS